MRVLLIDLGPELIELVESALSGSQRRPWGGVIEAVNGLDAAAESLAAGAPPGLALVGIDSIASVEGRQRLSRLRAMAEELPLVVLSERPDPTGIAIALGAQDCLHSERLDVELLSRSLRHAVERGRLQSELKRANAFLHNIVDNIPLSIIVKRAEDLSFALVNEAAERLLGFPRDEILGKTDGHFYPADEAEAAEDRDRQILERKARLDLPRETLHTRHLGERVLRGKKVPIIDDDGRARYLLGITEDITERLRTEAELEEKAEQLR